MYNNAVCLANSLLEEIILVDHCVNCMRHAFAFKFEEKLKHLAKTPASIHASLHVVRKT